MSIKQRKEENKDPGIYINKQRTLIFSTRGISHRHRHLMSDLRDLLPHSRKDVKFDIKRNFREVSEVAEQNSCNNCIFFEVRKNTDLYMWLSRCPNGPTMRFQVKNVHTMAEVKLTGNCLRYTRPILNFDLNFNSSSTSKLMKEMLQQIFGSPKGHPKVQPFIDHIFNFYLVDGEIHFRNYQIVYGTNKREAPTLVEIGPRFVLVPHKIFSGSFQGSQLWENPEFISPNLTRSLLKRNLEMKNKRSKEVSLRGNKRMKRTFNVPSEDNKSIFT